MRRVVLLAIAIAVVLLGTAAWLLWPHAVNVAVRNYPSQGTDVIAFGDSLVAGQGATAGHDLVSDLSALTSAHIINLGHSGDTTAQALARIRELDQYKPKVVIIVLGGNDYLQQLSMDQAFANLGSIIAAAQARGAAVLLVGFRISPIIGNFDSQFAALAKAYGTAYVPDTLDGILGNDALMSDAVHPNDQGYALMAQRIAPALEKLLH